jgi:ABC-2 type transport system permease protein
VVCITFVLETRNLPMKLMSGNASLSAMGPSLNASSRSAHLSPSHLFADVLLRLSLHDDPTRALAPLGIITLVVTTLFILCMWLGGRLLSMSNLTEESNGAQLASSSGEAPAWRRLFAVPTGSMIAKDLKFMWRDSMLTSQLSVPLILFAVPFLVSLQNHALDPATELYPFAAAIIAFILYMQTSILSLSLLGMESQSFWVVLTSPNSRRSLLLAKWAVSSLVSGGIGIALALVSGIIFHAPLAMLLLQLVLIATSAAALCALGIGLSALFPRFQHDNPAMRVSTGALIVGFFASTGYVLATGTLFGLAYFLTTSDRFPGHERSIWAASVGAYILLTVVAIALPLTLGALRIERYEWEH